MRYSTQQLREFWAGYRCDPALMVACTFGPTSLLVAENTRDAWKALAQVMAAHGYVIRKADTGAYNCRAITGGDQPSLHSYGIAADVNWRTNPYKKTPSTPPVVFSSAPDQDARALDVRFHRADTDMTPDMIDAIEAIVTKGGHAVFGWGGRFKTSKDAMHFQLDVSPGELTEGIDWSSVAEPDPAAQHSPSLTRSGTTPATGEAAAMNRAAFYDAIRGDLFHGTLTSSQVRGIEDILDVWYRLHPAGDPRWLAYILATVFHETDRRMVPVREGFATSNEGAVAAVHNLFLQGRIKVDYSIPVNGVSYYGRGRVQNTFLANYRKLEARFNHPFVANPDLLLTRPDLDAEVTVVGHVEGIWTGRKLSDHIGAAGCDFTGARAIVGRDRGPMIAGYALAFETALDHARSQPATAPLDAGAAGTVMIERPLHDDVLLQPDPAAMAQTEPRGEKPMSVPAQPDLVRILSALEALRAELAAANPGTGQPVTPASQPEAHGSPADISRILAALGTLFGRPPTPDRSSAPLGQVNGALGQALGNLLNGKKTAIGVVGAVATSILGNTSDPASVFSKIATLAPAALTGTSGVFLPLFLGMAAWGVLGKFEKWSNPPAEGTAVK